MPESPARVVALIVTWNRREAVAAALRALSAQEGHGARVRAIVVDNASTDDTTNVLSAQFAFARVLSNDTDRADRPAFVPAAPPAGLPEPGCGIESMVLVRNTHNLGGTGGFNTAMRALDSGAAFPDDPAPDFAWLLDDDVDLPPDALARLLEAARTDSRIALVGSRTGDINQRDRTIETTIYIDSEQGIMRDEPPEGHPARAEHLAWARAVGGTKGGTGYTGLREVDVVSACSMLARWSAVRDVGFWDDRFFIYCDDADWCWRMRRAGYRVVLCLDAAVFHTPWFAKLTPARTYYAQRNLLWMLASNHADPARAVRARIDALCRDAWRHALRRRMLHAEALRRACSDAALGVAGRVTGLEPCSIELDEAFAKTRRAIVAVPAPAALDRSRALRSGSALRASRRWAEFIANDVPGAHEPEPGVTRVVHSMRLRSLIRRHLTLVAWWRAPVVVFDAMSDAPLLLGGATLHLTGQSSHIERGGLAALLRFRLALRRTGRRARSWAAKLAPPTGHDARQRTEVQTP